MRQRLDQLLVPMLGALLLAVGLWLAVGLRRGPVNTPFVLNAEPAGMVTPSKGQPDASPVAARAPLAAIIPAGPQLRIRCKISLASCRRWVALRERNGRLFTRSAQR